MQRNRVKIGKVYNCGSEAGLRLLVGHNSGFSRLTWLIFNTGEIRSFEYGAVCEIPFEEL